ncbi:MAG: hypothetical protein OEQ39_13215, partial [Gammaproteobacteria bacterium]|nr:hypothetical protein [Gammaproteobacteria bacterium]
MIKALLRTGLSVLIVLGLLVGSLFFLANTEPGTRILWQIMHVVLDDAADIGTVTGRLRGPLAISEINVTSESMQVRIGQVRLNWDLTQLFKGALVIEELALKDVSYTRIGDRDSTNSSSQFQRLKLPFLLQVRQVSIQSVDIYSTPDAIPFRIDEASAVVNTTQNWIDVAQLSIQAPTGAVTGTSRLGLSNDYPVTGKIDWQVQPATLAAAVGSVALSGTVNRLTADVNAKNPYPVDARFVLSDLLSEPHYEFAIHTKELSLAAISSDWPPARISGRIDGRKIPADDATVLHTEITATGLAQLGSIMAKADARIGDNELVLIDLVLDAPDYPVRVNAGGRIDLTNDSPVLDLKTTWHDLRWPLQGDALLTSRMSRLDIQGPLLRPSFVLQAEVDGPLQSMLVDATAELDRSSDQLRVRLDARAHQLRWPLDGKAIIDNASAELQLAGTLPELDSQFQIRLANRTDAPTINGTGRLDFSDLTLPIVEIGAKWTAMRWPLNTAETMVRSDNGTVNVTGAPNDLAVRFEAKVDDKGQISGTVKYANDVTEIAAQWDQLTWLHWRQPLHSERGVVQLKGKPSDYRLQLDTVLASSDKQGKLSTEAHGNLSSLTLDDINLQILQGAITGSGELAWKPDIQANITLTGRDLNPATWWAEWPGLLNGNLDGVASLVGEKLFINRLELNADGQLRDYPLQLTTKGRWQANSAHIESLQLESAQSRLQAQGSVGKILALQWQVDSEDLRALHPQASGIIKGSGSLAGSVDRPQLKATLEGRELEYQNHSLEHLKLDTLIDITDQQISHMSVAFENARLAGVEIQRARINADGVTASHNIVLDAQSSQGALDLNIVGKFDNKKSQWLFDITDADLNTTEFGIWKLLSNTNGRFEDGAAELSATCFGSGNAEICLGGLRKDQNVKASLDVKHLSLAMLSPWLPEDVMVEGLIDGAGNFEWEGPTRLSGELDLRTSSGQILVTQDDTGSDSPERILVFEPGTANIGLKDNEIILNIHLPLPGEDSIQGRARIAAEDNEWTQRSLDAELKMGIVDIVFLAPLTPEIERLTGSLQGDMRISGSVQNPVYHGQILWKNGVVELLGPGIAIDNINAQISGNPQAGMDLKASARSGDGHLTVEGQVNFASGQPVVDISIGG